MENRIPVWECGCGSFEYAEFPPEECGKCGEGNGFVEVPEDKMKDLEKDMEENLMQKIRTKEFEELEDENDKH